MKQSWVKKAILFVITLCCMIFCVEICLCIVFDTVNTFDDGKYIFENNVLELQFMGDEWVPKQESKEKVRLKNSLIFYNIETLSDGILIWKKDKSFNDIICFVSPSIQLPDVTTDEVDCILIKYDTELNGSIIEDEVRITDIEAINSFVESFMMNNETLFLSEYGNGIKDYENCSVLFSFKGFPFYRHYADLEINRKGETYQGTVL